MRVFTAVALLLIAASSSAAQSFDCAKAQTPVEKMICGDAGLRELDEYMGRYFGAARATAAGAEACLQSNQREWLKDTRDACKDAACLRQAYLARLAELDPLQPGATAIKKIELPRVPSLVWIVPPALDRVAAPPNPKAVVFEAAGALVDEIASPKGEGFVIRTVGGMTVPLMMLMFLEEPTQTQLGILAKESGATFRARGFAATDSSGRRYFEPSRCTFLYRLPPAQAKPAAPAVPEDLQEMERVRTLVITQGKVCPDPDRPCEGFKPNELSFAIAKPFAFDRGRDRSQPFYAVILKSGPLCGVPDSERVKAQGQFPRAKVFLHRHMCEDFGDKVTYSGVNAKAGFVAVYAGETEAEAQKVLALAKTAGYADANIRRLEAIVVYQLE
jgi:uncharacterized protein